MPADLFQINGLGSGVDTASIVDALRQYKLRPVQVLKRKQDRDAAKQKALQDINARLLAFQTAADALTKTAAFSVVKAGVGDASVATATAGAGAVPGAANLIVSGLAQARRVLGKSYADPSAPAGLSTGADFVVNGKAVRVASDDSLSTLAAKINATGAGASAGVLQVAPGDFRLTIAGATTGAQDSLALADVQAGTSLQTLGLITGGLGETRYVTSGAPGVAASALSSAFAGAPAGAAKLGALLGLGADFAGTFYVNGGMVAYDTATATLASLAGTINALGIDGLSASVVAGVTAGGAATERLQITGRDGAPTFSDDAKGLLNLLGVTRPPAAAGTVTRDARDAAFSLDGIALRRPTNTVGDALTGVTLALKKDGDAATTLTISRDTPATVEAVTKFVQAYNDVAGTIRRQSTLAAGASAASAPVLLGDSTLRRVQDELVQSVMSRVSGAAAAGGAALSSLADVGVKLGQDGSLSLDGTALTAALEKDPNAVARLFTRGGSATDPAITYFSSTSATRDGDYGVQITAPAMQAQGTAGGAPHADGLAEVLTFGGALFPTPVTVSIPEKSALDAVIAQINAGAPASRSVVAYDDGGRLGLRSIGYGTAHNFTVISNQPADKGASGIGNDVPLSATGVNVAGTMGGEAATGSGRTLTGSQPDGAANGLAVTATATRAGLYGSVSVRRGAAAAAVRAMTGLTDYTSGQLKLEQDSLRQRITDADATIADLTARVDKQIARMQAQFTRMETQISRLKAQSSQLGQQIAGLSGLNPGDQRK